jgi:hypothetical protein
MAARAGCAACSRLPDDASRSAGAAAAAPALEPHRVEGGGGAPNEHRGEGDGGRCGRPASSAAAAPAAPAAAQRRSAAAAAEQHTRLTPHASPAPVSASSPSNLSLDSSSPCSTRLRALALPLPRLTAAQPKPPQQTRGVARPSPTSTPAAAAAEQRSLSLAHPPRPQLAARTSPLYAVSSSLCCVSSICCLRASVLLPVQLRLSRPPPSLALSAPFLSPPCPRRTAPRRTAPAQTSSACTTASARRLCVGRVRRVLLSIGEPLLRWRLSRARGLRLRCQRSAERQLAHRCALAMLDSAVLHQAGAAASLKVAPACAAGRPRPVGRVKS